MWVEFQPQQIWHVDVSLGSTLARERGIEIWCLHQHQRRYCAKFLTAHASQQVQHAHQQELVCYQQQLNIENVEFQTWQSLCLPAQIVSKNNLMIDRQISPMPFENLASDVLVLPYADRLEKILSTPQNLTLDLKLTWFLQILRQVKALQSLGYLHGDLKLQHVVHWGNQLKLIDFAQIQRLDAAYGVQEKGGTPAYMAPELFLGQAKTMQSEIYALGILFYQLLMGKKPFTAQSYQQWAVQHCQQVIPLLPNHLQVYQKILDKMLAKRLENRFFKLEEIESALNLIEIS